MSKELETKLVRLFKNYMNHNQIASKAQQFNCSRPRTCFPKDGSREQLQQSSWSCDLSFGVAFKKIYQLTVTAVTSATSSLGR